MITDSIQENSDAVRLLYMEDDQAIARLLQKAMSSHGYIVDLASNGAEGIAMLERQQYAAVLVDYSMPNLGGLEVIASLSGIKDAPPTIMLTGSGNERIAVEALKMGASEYLVKDLDMNYLQILPMVLAQVLRNQELVAERQRMATEIRESEARYRQLVELSPDGIGLIEDGRFIFINPAGVVLLKASSAESLIGSQIIDLVHPEWRVTFKEMLLPLQQDTSPHIWQEVKVVRLDSHEIDVEFSGIPFQSAGKTSIQLIFRDITERNQDKLRLERLANLDTLTELPNRQYFFDRLYFLQEHSTRYHSQFALLFMDLDGFKEINDTLGHGMGDELLKETATRLKTTLRNSDLVARMGGDEFVALLPKVDSPQDATIAAEKLLESMGKPFVLNNHRCSVGISIGISIYYPDHAADGDSLLIQADAAMYKAKQLGKNRYYLAKPPIMDAAAEA
jgi:diguanylate cyclase (GGDEF)-like protein/PAS domain S-box-containing protein